MYVTFYPFIVVWNVLHTYSHKYIYIYIYVDHIWESNRYVFSPSHFWLAFPPSNRNISAPIYGAMIKAFGEAGHLHQVGWFRYGAAKKQTTVLCKSMWVALTSGAETSITIYKLEHWWGLMLWACYFLVVKFIFPQMYVARCRYDHWKPIKSLEGSWTLGPIAGEPSWWVKVKWVISACVLFCGFSRMCTVYDNEHFTELYTIAVITNSLYRSLIFTLIHISVKVNNASCKRRAMHVVGSFSYWCSKWSNGTCVQYFCLYTIFHKADKGSAWINADSPKWCGQLPFWRSGAQKRSTSLGRGTTWSPRPSLLVAW